MASAIAHWLLHPSNVERAYPGERRLCHNNIFRVTDRVGNRLGNRPSGVQSGRRSRELPGQSWELPGLSWELPGPSTRLHTRWPIAEPIADPIGDPKNIIMAEPSFTRVRTLNIRRMQKPMRYGACHDQCQALCVYMCPLPNALDLHVSFAQRSVTDFCVLPFGCDYGVRKMTYI